MADLPPVIKTLIAEALGEGPEGMRLVGETILNRSQQRGIPPERVVAQPYQYTGYSNPGPAAQRAFSDPEAISAAEAAWRLAQGPDDPTLGANHYYAQNTISQPSWARDMTNTVTSGGHTFYTDRPFTQRPIPAAAPTLSTMSPTTAALRQMTSPTGGNSLLQSALNTYATRERNRVTPASAEDRVTARNRQFFTPPQDGPVNASAARRAVLSMGGNQTYAGQERGRMPFGGDPLTPSNGPVVATIPTAKPNLAAAARRAVLSMGGNQTYAGQERGKMPTRSVVPLSSAPVSYAGQERSLARPATTAAQIKANDIGSMPSFAEMGATLGRPLAPSQVPALYDNVFPKPLATNVPNRPGAPMQVAVLNNTVGPSGLRTTTPTKLAPVPATRPGNQVATQLSVAQPTSAAPVPFMRPAGLGSRPVNSAPVPMQRPTSLPVQMSAQRRPALVAPVAAVPMMGARPPVTVYVRGSNTIQPAPVVQAQPQSLYYSNPIAFGQRAVSQSGDTSVGSQADAAAARSSGSGGRNRRY